MSRHPVSTRNGRHATSGHQPPRSLVAGCGRTATAQHLSLAPSAIHVQLQTYIVRALEPRIGILGEAGA